MFLGEVFISTEALISIMLLLFDFSVCLIYAVHLVLPKPLQAGYTHWEELLVPPLEEVLKAEVRTVKKKKKRRR